MIDCHSDAYHTFFYLDPTFILMLIKIRPLTPDADFSLKFLSLHFSVANRFLGVTPWCYIGLLDSVFFAITLTLATRLDPDQRKAGLRYEFGKIILIRIHKTELT